MKQNRSPLQPALRVLTGRPARPSTHLITRYQYTGVSSLQVRGGQDSEETGSVHFAPFKALGLPTHNFYSPRCIDVSVQAGVWLLYTVKSWTSRVIKIKGSGLALSSDFVVLSQWRLTGQRDGHCHGASTALASDPGGHHYTQTPTSSWREPAQFQGPGPQIKGILPCQRCLQNGTELGQYAIDDFRGTQLLLKHHFFITTNVTTISNLWLSEYQHFLRK